MAAANLDFVCRLRDCLDLWLVAGCLLGFVVCVVTVVTNRNRWFR